MRSLLLVELGVHCLVLCWLVSGRRVSICWLLFVSPHTREDVFLVLKLIELHSVLKILVLFFSFIVHISNVQFVIEGKKIH